MANRTDIEELISWLKTDEAASREKRAHRLSYVLKVVQPPKNGICFQGEISLQSFEEVRRAYIHGLYLATVLLSLTCIEREIAGRLYTTGWEKAKHARLEELLLKAFENGMISVSELNTFQHLRLIRNSQTHFRSPRTSSSMLRRTVDQDILPNEIFMKDAEQAIEALGRFFEGRTGFF